MPHCAAKQVLKRHSYAGTGGGISDEEVYARHGEEAQASDQLSASGSDMETLREADAERQQHPI